MSVQQRAQTLARGAAIGALVSHVNTLIDRKAPVHDVRLTGAAQRLTAPMRGNIPITSFCEYCLTAA
jgi:hypothetical protein